MGGGNRYSEFRDLRRKLTIMFPDAGVAMPRLPPKSVMREVFFFGLFIPFPTPQKDVYAYIWVHVFGCCVGGYGLKC